MKWTNGMKNVWTIGQMLCLILAIASDAAPELELVDELEETERGDAGFGSTGR